MSVKIYLSKLSVVAPGLESWQQSKALLSGKEAYIKKELSKIAPTILPANERRRTTPLIKLALHAAEQCIGSDLSVAAQYATVFASSDGDHAINDKMCTAINLPERAVSPTNFHNSVHNAPAGYWAIAAKAQLNSNSLSACNESFAAGLIEAATFTKMEKKPVLLVAYDIPAQQPFDIVRHLEDTFAVAMCLSYKRTENSIAELVIEPATETNYSVCDNNVLEKMRLGNPAARSLPLLEVLAKEKNNSVLIPNVQSSSLKINVNFL